VTWKDPASFPRCPRLRVTVGRDVRSTRPPSGPLAAAPPSEAREVIRSRLHAPIYSALEAATRARPRGGRPFHYSPTGSGSSPREVRRRSPGTIVFCCLPRAVGTASASIWNGPAKESASVGRNSERPRGSVSSQLPWKQKHRQRRNPGVGYHGLQPALNPSPSPSHQ
jgi:hypothetical protein